MELVLKNNDENERILQRNDCDHKTKEYHQAY
jgi:hypothetical protein